MAGPYAHITLLHELMRTDRLETVFSSSSQFYDILTDYFPYAALGSISPDYPNLARDNGCAAQWADAMHNTRACAMISSGIKRVRGSQGAVRDKQTAWLLGYSAHAATDATIHPIVQAKVGVYAENQRHHRLCEMNQDSYIYRRMNLGEIGVSDSFALTVARCGDADDKAALDRDIVLLWQGMLEDTHPEQYAAHPPSCVSWHRAYVARASDCRAGEVRLFPLAGVIAAKMELSYPAFKAIDRQYIDEQVVPSVLSCSLGYDDIFDHAAENVVTVWKQIQRAVCGEDQSYVPAFGEWNLDTGRDEHDKLVFW